MTPAVFAYLAGSTGVFMVANSLLKTYAAKGGLGMLVAALAAFCLGNFLMVRVMRENGLGIALPLSLVFQLVAITIIAFVVFHERPTVLQMAGVGLGIVAIGMIAWPTGGAT
jgi:small multidrug resistance pump